MSTQRNIQITAALLYANGDLHLGHLVEYLQADIWVRFQRMRGHNCLYICGSDSHGTPIMISAEKQGITPETLVKNMRERHLEDFSAFSVEFDCFHSTHSDENRELTYLIYERLKANGDIEAHEIEQAYDPIKNMFLPDRYVKGECPCCSAKDQYGDNCEACGSTYLSSDLKNPKSVLSDVTPIQKKSTHYFFKLEHYEAILKEWVSEEHLQPAIVHKLREWFKEGLMAWDISRDAPYFGFEIPDQAGKYFYVWLDAPIGYMASLKKLCESKKELNVDDVWKKDSSTELYHFVGKDIVYFHALFWPAVLESAGFRKPTRVFAHGFLTINGQKMSKSRDTFIKARDYITASLDPEYLRYYYAAKLSDAVEDIDLNFEDFTARVNSDLVGKVVNIASRCAGFIHKQFDGKLSEQLDKPELFDAFVKVGDEIADCFEARQYSQAVRKIMNLADNANRYIDDKKPWVLAKEEGKEDQVQLVCTMGLNLFKILMLYLKPILPVMAKKVEDFLNIEPLSWNDRKQPLLNHNISSFKPLMQRIQKEQIDQLLTHEKIESQA